MQSCKDNVTCALTFARSQTAPHAIGGGFALYSTPAVNYVPRSVGVKRD